MVSLKDTAIITEESRVSIGFAILVMTGLIAAGYTGHLLISQLESRISVLEAQHTETEGRLKRLEQQQDQNRGR